MDVAYNPHLGDADEFLSQHLKLVYHVAKKFRGNSLAPGYSYEDIIGAGMIGLVKAYQSFDPQKAKWTTYAGLVIRTEILLLFRKIKKAQREDYAENPMFQDEEGHEVTILDMLGNPDDNTNVQVQEFLESLDKRDRLILTLRIQGADQREIASKIGVSQPAISRSLKRIASSYVDENFCTKQKSVG